MRRKYENGDYSKNSRLANLAAANKKSSPLSAILHQKSALRQLPMKSQKSSLLDTNDFNDEEDEDYTKSNEIAISLNRGDYILEPIKGNEDSYFVKSINSNNKNDNYILSPAKKGYISGEFIYGAIFKLDS